MRFAFALLALVAAFSCMSAISVLAPVSAQVDEGSQITIGNVGPGQTFFVVADPKVSTGGAYGAGGAYDRMFATLLPEGWNAGQSKLYANPLQTDITVPKDAADGEYLVGMTLWDEAGAAGLGGNVTFFAKVTVTRDVMSMQVDPTFLSVGAGQPARYAITLVNKGIANDVFTVGSLGVRNWEFRRTIYIPAASSKTLTYELVGDDEADYQVRIWARSASSDQISSEVPVSLRVNTDLFSDYRAINKGVLLFPMTEAPAYFVMGFLSNFLPS